MSKAENPPAWTPGPWEVRGCELVGEGTLLATLCWHSGRARENKADAALITAAPELFDALDAIDTWLRAGIGDGPALQVQAANALAKAKGAPDAQPD